MLLSCSYHWNVVRIEFELNKSVKENKIVSYLEKSHFCFVFEMFFPGGDVLNNWCRIIFKRAIYSFENGFWDLQYSKIDTDLAVDESVGVAGLAYDRKVSYRFPLSDTTSPSGPNCVVVLVKS